MLNPIYMSECSQINCDKDMKLIIQYFLLLCNKKNLDYHDFQGKAACKNSTSLHRLHSCNVVIIAHTNKHDHMTT